MKTNGRPTPDILDDDARRAALAGFINSLRRRPCGIAAETALPQQLEAVRQAQRDEGQTVKFGQAAASIGVQVHPATTADWLDVLATLLREHHVQSVAIPQVNDGFFETGRVEQLKQRLASVGVNAKSETDDETLFSVDAAITGVVAAIAETGTLVCESRPVVARGSSLIPPVHFAVVAAPQLVPDLYDYLEELGARPDLPANVNLISGPSKTADIEGVLVTGVHGPGELHVVLVGEL